MEKMTPLILLGGFLLILLLPDFYIRSTVLKDAAIVWRVLWWLPSMAVIALLILMVSKSPSQALLSLFTGFVLCLLLPKLLFTIVSLLSKAIGLAWPMASKVSNGIGLCLSLILALIALDGWQIGWKKLSIRRVELTFNDLPEAFDDYRIIQLSDLHVGTYGNNTAFLEKLVQRANEENADLIVFTGDLINTSPSEVAPFEPILSNLRAKDGIISVLGNHDYCIYGMSRQRPANFHEAVQPVKDAERRMGWELLLNGHRIIKRGEDQIAIVGVENTGKPPFPEIGDLKGAMTGIPDSTFKVLLSHDPSHWRMEVLPTTSIPLTLSGHTHAMQFKLFGWSPSKWLYPEWGGLYTEGKQQLFVSEGIGGTIPFRFGTKPEMIVFTLKRGS